MSHAWRVPTDPAHGGKDSIYGHACLPVGRGRFVSFAVIRTICYCFLWNLLEKGNATKRIALGTFHMNISFSRRQ
jgi:hypothetical protein